MVGDGTVDLVFVSGFITGLRSDVFVDPHPDRYGVKRACELSCSRELLRLYSAPEADRAERYASARDASCNIGNETD